MYCHTCEARSGVVDSSAWMAVAGKLVHRMPVRMSRDGKRTRG
jgi:hypothetical protein